MYNSQKSFWQLLQEYNGQQKHIEIPTIQRDYAQGRDTKEALTIRKSFLENIITALESHDGQSLNLDFIYGKEHKIGIEQTEIEQQHLKNMMSSISEYISVLSSQPKIIFNYDQLENHSNNIDCYFIPLDGQQRLTTLFLFHWYLLYRIQNSISKNLIDYLTTLNHFHYKTRPSTEEFIQLICTKEFLTSITSKQKEISANIQSKTNYFSQWDHDPTVLGMLNTLDSIHEKLSSYPEEHLLIFWERLTNCKSPKIVFNYLNVQDIQQDDKLYIKMNARGKQLTLWENFKAALIYSIDKNENLISPGIDWKKNLEIKWYDFFWSLTAINKEDQYVSSEEVDDNYLHYFKIHFLLDSINLLNEQEIKQLRSFNDITVLNIVLTKTNNNPSIFIDHFKFLDWLSNLNTETDEAILSCISPHYFSGKPTSFKSYFNNLSKNTSSLSYPDLAFLYAVRHGVLRFNISPNEIIINHFFTAYCRFISNLIYNQPFDSKDHLSNALQSINAIVDHFNTHSKQKKKDFYERIIVTNQKSNDINFVSDNYKEEINKAELLLKAREHFDHLCLLFSKYENNKYFYGQIRFLLTSLESMDINIFEENGTILNEIFDSFLDTSEDSNLLFRRALLSYEDYLIKGHFSDNKTLIKKNAFGNWREANENWRRIFHKDQQNLLTNLSRDITKYPQRNIAEALKFIILENKKHINDYRYLIIDEPNVMEISQKLEIRPFDKNIYILPKLKLTSQYVEIHSYYLYLKLRQDQYTIAVLNIEIPNIKYWSYGDKNIIDDPYMELLIKEKRYQIHTKYDSGHLLIICDDQERILIHNHEKNYQTLYQDFIYAIKKVIE